MPSANFFDQREALAIAQKLDAEIITGREHDLALIRWQGRLIGKYGIRRDRRAPHPYIPKQIGLKLREAIQLARCPMTAQRYFELMRERGRL